MTKSTAEMRPEPICGMNTWMPVPASVLDMRKENFNTRTFTLHFVDEKSANSFALRRGSSTCSTCPAWARRPSPSVPIRSRTDTLDHTIRLVGSVTRAVERLQGGLVGLRGPFGRGWPLEAMEGSDVVIVAGGIGLAPLRPVIYWLLQHRERCKRVVLLYGCRTPEDRVFAEELEQWDAGGSIQVLVTVDNATGAWAGPVGVVTTLLRRIKVNAERTIVLVCGPKILNHVAAWNFLQLHVPPEHVYVSLERNMNCGFGRCGHCQYGGKFMCKDGPVFCFSEVGDIFGKEEI